MMKYKDLIKACVELLDGFNPNIHGVQEYVDSHLSSIEVKTIFGFLSQDFI